MVGCLFGRWNEHWAIAFSIQTGRLAPFSSRKPLPADIGKNPRGGFCFNAHRKSSLMRGIVLWLLGVPIIVIIGLYLFNVL